MANEASVSRVTARYPPADITPAECESFVADLLNSARNQLEDLTVTPHEKITAADGAYDFDVTVRFSWSGMSFLVLVEVKRHKNPIKREMVAILLQKIHSVGAHKGVMVSTAPYQSGALEFAKAHGIALATITEGRFTLETRDAFSSEPMSRDEARKYGIETFVGHVYSEGSTPGSTRVTVLTPQHPEFVVDHLLGLRLAE